MRIVADINIFEDEALRQAMLHWSSLVMLATLIVFVIAATFSAATVASVALSVVVGLVATALSLPIHEATHALFFKLLGSPGSSISFGFEDAFLYTRYSGDALARWRFICVLIAPSVVLSATLLALGHATGWPLAGLLACGLHLSGCVGDLLMVGVILRTPEARYVEDSETGCRLLANDDPQAEA